MLSIEYAKFIPWLPALASILCAICCMKRSLRVFAAPICILSILGGFIISFLISSKVGTDHTQVVEAFEWINIGGLKANFAYFIDPLTIIMLFVVTGIGSLVAIYASGYMAGDRGYARFFFGVSLFIFAMTTLVMADNLVLLYLGWEGVGLCSYLLIGFYYDKPSAVAAAKKAFIVNRIGDLGFALGIFLIYQAYGTVSLQDVIHQAQNGGPTDQFANTWIPFLLMLGAFGKSAQLPLYVWLPDAMEGPTPVSALIHAATMVTAGVYMIARLLPVFELSPYALPTVAVVGCITALFAATIALCQYDIKRIFAYSTISQLGYMFLGVGVLSSVGGVFHLFTHAFFKALLFLTAGSVMHALAGQLDLRKMSGLRKKMPVTATLMLIGCLALAGFPFLSGFYSKDMILAATMQKGIGEHGQILYLVLAITGLVTALLTAYYTFRLWFRVFLGPCKYEMGDEHHAAEEQHADIAPDIKVEHHHEPHEMSWLMNGPLVILAIGAVIAGFWAENSHWMHDMIQGSTAAVTLSHTSGAVELHTTDVNRSLPEPVALVKHHAQLFGIALHTAMMIISSIIAITGIIIAAYFHWYNRDAADRIAKQYPTVVKTLANKYYVDEIYDAAIVRPLHLLGQIFYVFDQLIIDGLVLFIGLIPKLLGLTIRPLQNASLQGYGVGMIVGIVVLILLILNAV